MYSELKKIYDKTRLDVFSMAITHLIDIGFRKAKEITDDDIEKLEENGLMTKEFVQDIVTLARDIAKVCDNPSELFQFCQSENIFDTLYYSGKPNRKEMDEAINNAIYEFRYDDRRPCDDSEIIECMGFDEDEAEYYDLKWTEKY